MSLEQPAILIRPAVDSDHACVISNFLKSYRLEGRNQHMSNAVYYAHFTRAAVAMAHGTVLVAVNPEDDWQILGWLALEPGDGVRLAYAYVKSPFRRMGIFTRLLSHANPEGAPVTAARTGRLFIPLRDRFDITFTPGDNE